MSGVSKLGHPRFRALPPEGPDFARSLIALREVRLLHCGPPHDRGRRRLDEHIVFDWPRTLRFTGQRTKWFSRS